MAIEHYKFHLTNILFPRFFLIYDEIILIKSFILFYIIRMILTHYYLRINKNKYKLGTDEQKLVNLKQFLYIILFVAV